MPSGPPSRPPPPALSTDTDNPIVTSTVASTHSSVGQIIESEEEVPSWRRPGSFRARQQQAANGGGPSTTTPNHHPAPQVTVPVVKVESSGQMNRSISQPLAVVTAVVSSVSVPSLSSSSNSTSTTSSSTTPSSVSSSTTTLSAPETDVTLRRAHSFESDERFVLIIYFYVFLCVAKPNNIR